MVITALNIAVMMLSQVIAKDDELCGPPPRARFIFVVLSRPLNRSGGEGDEAGTMVTSSPWDRFGPTLARLKLQRQGA